MPENGQAGAQQVPDDVFEKALRAHNEQYEAAESDRNWMPPPGPHTFFLAGVRKGLYPKNGSPQFPYISAKFTIVGGECNDRSFSLFYGFKPGDAGRISLSQLKTLVALTDPAVDSKDGVAACNALTSNIGAVYAGQCVHTEKNGRVFKNVYVNSRVDAVSPGEEPTA
jgi:hypothetical protein